MKLLAWNYRGMGQASVVKALKELKRRSNPTIIYLMETKKKSSRLERIRNRFGFTNSFYVEPKGKSGGLALWWSDDCRIDILSSCSAFIDTRVEWGSPRPWFCTFIYGNPKKELRQEEWVKIGSLRREEEKEWACLGDFNAYSFSGDKYGGRGVNSSQMNQFNNFLENANLIELHIHGAMFSWNNRRQEEENIQERIDRAYGTAEWFEMFPKAQGTYDTSFSSDHRPIIINLSQTKRNQKREFKFEDKWLQREDCKEVIGKAWETQIDGSRMFKLSGKLKATANHLRQWSKEVVGNTRRKINELTEHLHQLQNQPFTAENKNNQEAIMNQLEEQWKMEESYWGQ